MEQHFEPFKSLGVYRKFHDFFMKFRILFVFCIIGKFSTVNILSHSRRLGVDVKEIHNFFMKFKIFLVLSIIGEFQQSIIIRVTCFLNTPKVMICLLFSFSSQF